MDVCKAVAYKCKSGLYLGRVLKPEKKGLPHCWLPKMSRVRCKKQKIEAKFSLSAVLTSSTW